MLAAGNPPRRVAPRDGAASRHMMTPACSGTCPRQQCVLGRGVSLSSLTQTSLTVAGHPSPPATPVEMRGLYTTRMHEPAKVPPCVLVVKLPLLTRPPARSCSECARPSRSRSRTDVPPSRAPTTWSQARKPHTFGCRQACPCSAPPAYSCKSRSATRTHFRQVRGAHTIKRRRERSGGEADAVWHCTHVPPTKSSSSSRTPSAMSMGRKAGLSSSELECGDGSGSSSIMGGSVRLGEGEGRMRGCPGGAPRMPMKLAWPPLGNDCDTVECAAEPIWRPASDGGPAGCWGGSDGLGCTSPESTFCLYRCSSPASMCRCRGCVGTASWAQFSMAAAHGTSQPTPPAPAKSFDF